jgi:hypothetical protein
MSIIKLLSSLSNPHQSTYFKDDSSEKIPTRDEKEGERFHSKTFGISSDPITRFALAFASLIHDVGKLAVSIGASVVLAMLANTTLLLNFSKPFLIRPSWSAQQSTGEGEIPLGTGFWRQVHCRTKLIPMCVGSVDGSKLR